MIDIFIKKISLFIILLFLFIGCKRSVYVELEREEKFSLDYGSFENQLNLFALNSSYTRYDTQILMQDGIFYIANSAGQKVLKLSSFGDLLSFFYNPETNAAPSFFNDEENVDIKTRKAIKYPFNHPALLSLTLHQHLFIVDSVDDERIEYDHEGSLALRDIILHFDEAGNFVDYIGQEGVNGTPFPSIESIHTNAANDVIVVCRTQDSLKIYWYNSVGELIYKIPIFFDSLPHSYDKNVKVFSYIDKAIPDFDELKLYIKIDYYVEEKDGATKAHIGVSYDKSSVYFLNIKTGRYEQKTDIDPYEGVDIQRGKTVKFKKVYEILGITKNDLCYLLTPINKGYALEIIDLKSQRKYKKDLIVASNETLYNTFHVSSDGIISGLLAQDNKALIVWWRADRIMGEK